MVRKEVIPVDTSAMDVYRSSIFPGGHPDGYQRALNNHWVNEIVANFNEDIVKQVTLSHRDGKFWVIDGQHTIAALKMRNGGNDRPVECLVYDGLTVKDEANLFLLLNDSKYSKPVTVSAKAAARFGSLQDKEICDIVDAAKRAGIEVRFRPTSMPAGATCAVNALTRAWKRLGGEPRFGDMLTALISAWGGDPESLRSDFINGMAEFMVKFDQGFSRARLAKVLRETAPSDIRREAKLNSGSTGAKYAKVFTALYNKRLKSSQQLSWA